MLHMTSRQIEIRLRPTNPTYSLFSSRTMDFPFMTNASEVLPALMTSHPVIAIPYVFLLALFSFTGTVGNLLVIGTNLTAKKKDQMIGDAFIVNLAASDMIVTALINPVAIMGKVVLLVKHISTGHSIRQLLIILVIL